MSGAEIAVIAVAIVDAVIAALPAIIISVALQLVVSLITGTPSSSSSTTINGQRMSDTGIPNSGWTIPIPLIFGEKTRATGVLIWSNQLREKKSIEVATQVSGGGKAGKSTTTSTTTNYSYFADFAIMFCAGPIASYDVIRANGKVLSSDFLAKYCTKYLGTTTQAQDITISDSMGILNTPAYRGRAYIVFKDVPLEDFQNHIPEVSAIMTTADTTVGNMITKLMTFIPYVSYSVDSAIAALSLTGSSINEISPVKAGIQVLSAAYGFVVVESDGILKFVRGRSG